MNDETKPMIELEAMAALESMGVHVIVNDSEENPGFALIPNCTEDSPDDWEKRSLAMHERQGSVKLEDKPEDDNMLRADAMRAKQEAERKGHGMGDSKVRGARVADPEDPENDQLPKHHRTGYGTVGLGVVKI